MNILSILNPHLKYPPVKYIPKPMPDYLIHRSVVMYEGFPVDTFTMFSTKNSEARAKTVMRCIPEHIKRDGKVVPSLYIAFLFSRISGLGMGTKMLNFAKNLSKQWDCDGRIHLYADNSMNIMRVPHPFYYKNGLRAKETKVNKRLARFIKQGARCTYLDFEATYMYYPPLKKSQEKIGFWEKVRDFFWGLPSIKEKV